MYVNEGTKNEGKYKAKLPSGFRIEFCSFACFFLSLRRIFESFFFPSLLFVSLCLTYKMAWNATRGFHTKLKKISQISLLFHRSSSGPTRFVHYSASWWISAKVELNFITPNNLFTFGGKFGNLPASFYMVNWLRTGASLLHVWLLRDTDEVWRELSLCCVNSLDDFFSLHVLVCRLTAFSTVEMLSIWNRKTRWICEWIFLPSKDVECN